jgi:DNA repair exonuclease SbcCD ATPase subunit
LRIENPITVNLNNYQGYPPHAPPTSSQHGSSETTAIQGPIETRPSDLTRVSSEESGIIKDLDLLEEFERLKTEVKHLRDLRDKSTTEGTEKERLKSRLAVERRDNERLRNEIAQLKDLLEDEKRKVLEKEAKVVWLDRLVKDYECQDQRASEFQAAAARTRHNYAEEMHIKENKTKKLEERCQVLEEDNQKYRIITEKLQEKSKEAEDQIRYWELQKSIAELEKVIMDLKTRRRHVGEQLSKAEGDWDSLRSGSGVGSSKNRSKTSREAEALVDRLNEDISTIRDELKKAEPQLAKLRAEFAGMPAPTDFTRDLARHPSSGSYDSQNEILPDLIADMSSRASGSPPQSDTLDTMDTFIDREIRVRQSNPNEGPWARTVEPSKRLSPRASEPFATLRVRQKGNLC